MKYQKYLKDMMGQDIKCFKQDVYCSTKPKKRYQNLKY